MGLHRRRVPRPRGVAHDRQGDDNLGLSIVTLLVVLVLQNTENRHSAALHVKLDEVVRADPKARDDLRGVESRPEREIRELTRDDEDALSDATGE